MSATATRVQTERFADAIQPLVELRRTELRVEWLGHRHRPAWDRYVRGHDAGTLFHQTAWLESVREVFGHEACGLMAVRGERIAGVLPLCVVRSRLGGTMLVSVPYAVAGGLLVSDEAARQVLWRRALALADEVGAASIDLRCENANSGAIANRDSGEDSAATNGSQHCPVAHAPGSDQWRAAATSTHVKFARELPTSANEVLEFLPRKARAAARNGEQRHGLIVEFGRHYLPAVWRLYCRSMRRLASISYPYAFFEQLVERYQRDAYVQIVRRGGQIVAGLVSFRFRDTFLPYFAGCDERFNHCQSNNVLYLAAMRRAVELGCRVFDFGRTRVDNRGAYDFKRLHGFAPQPLAYERWTRSDAAPSDLSAGAARFRIARRLWPLLPQGVCVRLSALLAPHIPG